MPVLLFMIFDWDENKEKSNVKNHDGVNFFEASRAIQDDFALNMKIFTQLPMRSDIPVSKEAETKFCMSSIRCETRKPIKKFIELFRRD